MEAATVSCILVARRPAPALRAVRLFLRQEYEPKELILADLCAQPIDAALPREACLRYLRFPDPPETPGAAAFAVAQARGEIVVHWHEDVWYAPECVLHLAGGLLRRDADVCCLDPPLFFHSGSAKWWQAACPRNELSLCYRRAVSEEAVSLALAGRLALLPNPALEIHIADSCAAPGRRAAQSRVPDCRAALGRDCEWFGVAAPPARNAIPPRKTPRRRPPSLPRPLVSAILLAREPRLTALAIDYFLRQDYQPRELIVIGNTPDSIADLIPRDQGIRHLRANAELPAGALRNLACSEARGEILAHWSESAWQSASRIRYMVEPLARGRADVTALNPSLWCDPVSQQAWIRQDPRRKPAGALDSVCYRRAVWQDNPFAGVDGGEVHRFLWNAQSARILMLEDAACHVAITARSKRLEDPYSWPFPLERIRGLLGSDWAFYEAELPRDLCQAPPVGIAQRAFAEPPEIPVHRPVAFTRGEPSPVSPLGERPLVSCIMPTCNRRRFVPLAVEYFLRQDYEPRELIVVDDGSDPVADLVPADDRVRYLRLERKLTVGAKRNLACQEARGEIIVHWDDDDWCAPHRIRYMAEALLREQADLCGLNPVLYHDLRSSQAWQFHYPSQLGFWVAGCSFCYRRDFWERNRFADVDVGEDNQFIWSAPPARMIALPEIGCLVSMAHQHNVSPKALGGPYWEPFPAEEIRRALGTDWDFYRQPHAHDRILRTLGADSSFYRSETTPPAHIVALPEPACHLAMVHSDNVSPKNSRGGGHEQVFPPREARKLLDGDSSQYARDRAAVVPVSGPTPSMGLTVARTSDLALTEFAAFNQGQSLPWMRRWELPFALFQARLSDTMSVLDCTLNPAGFERRLLELYPHVLYRHCTPIQNGAFAAPLGVPEQAFDRVICVNTLEHLLRPQREELIAAMARKLKPGGRLVLTSDYYFDSSWSQPAFSQAGLMREDRQEVFNGCNRVTFGEWIELCGRHGLRPLVDPPAEPSEQDPALYRNLPPLVHACIAGVFSKAPDTEPPSRTIVLALLTWNTCEASLESLAAYVREARMLERLGHRPLICVCDNGSHDGTAERLRRLDRELEVPHRFLFNRENLGNSIARNQIVDCMLESGGDYLLFMDGDIEIVPFSSFAMLRYLESKGHRLGCIGADSAGQTADRGQTTSWFYSVEGCRTETIDLVAWTQYGMFRRAIFEDGVRFDESAPFDGPGWGFEDNDLCFQMAVKGYLSQRFFGVVYLHRAARSSIRNLRSQGLDVHALYNLRRQFVIDKWSNVPRIDQGPLGEVRRSYIEV